MKKTLVAGTAYVDSSTADPGKLSGSIHWGSTTMPPHDDMLKKWKEEAEAPIDIRKLLVEAPGPVVKSLTAKPRPPGEEKAAHGTVHNYTTEMKLMVLEDRVAKFVPKSKEFHVETHVRYDLKTDGYQVLLRWWKKPDGRKHSIPASTDDIMHVMQVVPAYLLEKAAPGDFSAVESAMQECVKVMVTHIVEVKLKEIKKDELRREKERASVEVPWAAYELRAGATSCPSVYSKAVFSL